MSHPKLKGQIILVGESETYRGERLVNNKEFREAIISLAKEIHAAKQEGREGSHDQKNP